MMTQFINNFFQTSFLTTLWVMLLITLTNFHTTISFHYVWNIVAIGVLAGIIQQQKHRSTSLFVQS